MNKQLTLLILSAFMISGSYSYMTQEYHYPNPASWNLAGFTDSAGNAVAGDDFRLIANANSNTPYAIQDFTPDVKSRYAWMSKWYAADASQQTSDYTAYVLNAADDDWKLNYVMQETPCKPIFDQSIGPGGATGANSIVQPMGANTKLCNLYINNLSNFGTGGTIWKKAWQAAYDNTGYESQNTVFDLLQFLPKVDYIYETAATDTTYDFSRTWDSVGQCIAQRDCWGVRHPTDGDLTWWTEFDYTNNSGFWAQRSLIVAMVKEQCTLTTKPAAATVVDETTQQEIATCLNAVKEHLWDPRDTKAISCLEQCYNPVGFATNPEEQKAAPLDGELYPNLEDDKEWIEKKAATYNKFVECLRTEVGDDNKSYFYQFLQPNKAQNTQETYQQTVPRVATLSKVGFEEGNNNVQNDFSLGDYDLKQNADAIQVGLGDIANANNNRRNNLAYSTSCRALRLYFTNKNAIIEGNYRLVNNWNAEGVALDYFDNHQWYYNVIELIDECRGAGIPHHGGTSDLLNHNINGGGYDQFRNGSDYQKVEKCFNDFKHAFNKAFWSREVVGSSMIISTVTLILSAILLLL